MEDLIKGELDWHNKVNENFHEVDSQMAEKAINVLHPPVPLLAAKGDGITDDSTTLQNIINFAQNNGYSNVFVPSNTNKYKCNNTITIDISKISFVGNCTLFDFSSMTTGDGFIITAPTISYFQRYKFKREFTGIIINPNLSQDVRININGIKFDNEKELDNFVLKKCCVMNCNNALITRHAWRVRIEDCLFLWNNHHINTAEDVFDSGENCHYSGCMFADGGTLEGNIESMFTNCSFDNVAININKDLCFFDNCHFERGYDGTLQTTPYASINSANCGGIFNNCAFIMNGNKWITGLFHVDDNCVWQGLTLNNCNFIINQDRLSIVDFISRGEVPALITGKGRIQISNIVGWVSDNSAVGVSKYLNKINNGDCVKNTIPFTMHDTTGTLEISQDDKFTGTQSFKIACAHGQNVFADITLNVKPGQTITGGFMYKIHNNGSTNGKLAWKLSFQDDNGNTVTSTTGKINYLTATDTSDTWKYSQYCPYDIVPTGASKAIFEIEGLNGSEQIDDLVIYLDEIILNVI
ncbi:hypothetical protein [Clostridium tyrobutyricum]|uniref:hypothetical protein n=1 Tax=Clostridium tyrobutyricum TaxID=1519 RepID=UPI0030D3BBE4